MQQVATHDYKPGRDPVTITISKEANLRDITRATAHEVAEIQKLLVDPNAVHNDALKKGSTSTDLTAHDEGRLAELNVLLYELDNVSEDRRRTEIKTEIDALLEDIGIDKRRRRNSVADRFRPRGGDRGLCEALRTSADRPAGFPRQ